MAMICFTVCQAVFLTCAKLLILEVHPTTVLFARSLFGVLVFLPWMLKRKFICSKSNLTIHLVRSSAFLIGGIALFISIGSLPLTTVVMITYTSPILVCIAAAFLFKESVSLHHVIALIMSFVGVNLLFSGEILINTVGILSALLATVMLTVAQLSLKWLSANENKIEIFVTQLVFTLPILGLLYLTFGALPDINHLPMLLLMSASYVLSQLFLISALSNSQLNQLMPLDAIRLVLVALAGLLLFGETIDMPLIIGNLLILLATAITLKPVARTS